MLAGIYAMNAERMAAYLMYLNARGYTIEEFRHPRDGRPAYRMIPLPVSGFMPWGTEFVDMATGEIGTHGN